MLAAILVQLHEVRQIPTARRAVIQGRIHGRGPERIFTARRHRSNPPVAEVPARPLIRSRAENRRQILVAVRRTRSLDLLKHHLPHGSFNVSISDKRHSRPTFFCAFACFQPEVSSQISQTEPRAKPYQWGLLQHPKQQSPERERGPPAESPNDHHGGKAHRTYRRTSAELKPSVVSPFPSRFEAV
jgi:hypothetical protein